MSKREKISISFIVALLVSNILAVKLFSIGQVVLPAAVIVYPFCFMIGDILTEVWGYNYAKKVIYAGFIANFVMVLFTYLGGLMPPATAWGKQGAYIAIFGMVPRIVFGSFIAYLFGELLNSWSMQKIKSWTGKKLLFVRTIGSSIVGQIVDTGFFITIAFYGTMPNKVFLTLIISQYFAKICIEALVGTPLAYLFVNWAREDKSLSSRYIGSDRTCA